MITSMGIGEKITLCRKKAGLSQEELAERLAISRQAVSRWETGAASPDTERVVALSRLFGVSTDYLLFDELEEPESPAKNQAAKAEKPSEKEPAGDDPAAKRKERQRKFRIALGVCLVLLGLGAAVVAVVFIQLYQNDHAWEMYSSTTYTLVETGEEYTEPPITAADIFRRAMGGWRGGLLGGGIFSLLSGAAVLVREYFRKD